MRITGLALVPVAALVACSSGGSSTAAAAPTVTTVDHTQNVVTPTGNITLSTKEDRDVIVAVIPAPIDSVWHLLPGIFLELQVEPAQVNNEGFFIANTSFTVRRTLGGERISKYLNCGSSIAGQIADQSQITMSLTVQAVPVGDLVSDLRTQVSAYAVSEGASVGAVACASTGALEARIARMVNDALKRRAKN